MIIHRIKNTPPAKLKHPKSVLKVERRMEMNVHTKTWARPLALFIALTMIMMYSFGGVVFASINDVRVHYHGPSDDQQTLQLYQ